MNQISASARTARNLTITTRLGTKLSLIVLNDMQKKIRMASDELQRMESEGGKPLNTAQSNGVNNEQRVNKRMHKLLLVQPALPTPTGDLL